MAVSKEKLEKAHLLWETIQEEKAGPQWEGFLKKFGDPLLPPVDEVKLDAFILEFGDVYLGKKTPEQVSREIDNKKLRSFVDTYEKEAKKIDEFSATTNARGKARTQDIIRHALETPIAPAQKELVFQILQEKSEREPDKTIAELAPEAVKTGEAAQAFIQPIKTEDARAALRFVNLKDLSPIQQVVAPLADIAGDVITTINPDFRAGVLNILLAESFDKLIKNTDKLTTLLGGNIVNNPLYDQWLTSSKQLVAQGAAPGGVKTVFDDVFASLLRGSTDQTVVRYTELYSMGVIGPSADFSQLRGAGTGAGAALLHLGINIGLDKAKGAAFRAGLAKLGLEAAIPGAGWAAAIFGVGTGLFNRAVNWFKNLTGGKGSVPGDNWIMGIGCGAILLVFFILPIVSQLVIDSSLATRLNMGGGSTGGINTDCTQTPNNPQCKFTACVGDCKWPASGVITQGPFTGGFCNNPALTSHDVGNAANGIDIAAFGGGPIYAPKSGSIVEAYTACQNNSGKIGDHCGGSPIYAGYGNHIIMKTDDEYTLIFGHMESSMSVHAGQHVDAGTQLGWMDQTGNSTGTHLHFGVLSGGSVLDFVPKGNPALSPDAINGCVANTPGCRKNCPATAVSAK